MASKPDIGEQEINNVVGAASGRLSLWGRDFEFEEKFTPMLAESMLSVNSGTSALHLCIRALGIGSQDEVITTAFSSLRLQTDSIRRRASRLHRHRPGHSEYGRESPRHFCSTRAPLIPAGIHSWIKTGRRIKAISLFTFSVCPAKWIPSSHWREYSLM